MDAQIAKWLKELREIPLEGRIIKQKQEPHLRLVNNIEEYLQLIDAGEIEDLGGRDPLAPGVLLGQSPNEDTSILVERFYLADEEYYIDSAGWIYDTTSHKLIGKWDQDANDWVDLVQENWEDGPEDEFPFDNIDETLGLCPSKTPGARGSRPPTDSIS